MTSPFVTRRAGLGDLDAVVANLAVGLATYTMFAPAGWKLPDGHIDRAREAEFLADPETWAVLALVDEAPAGHVEFMAAREGRAGDPPAPWRARPVVPGLAHLRQLAARPAERALQDVKVLHGYHIVIIAVARP